MSLTSTLYVIVFPSPPRINSTVPLALVILGATSFLPDSLVISPFPPTYANTFFEATIVVPPTMTITAINAMAIPNCIELVFFRAVIVNIISSNGK
jgi:hypothetical protein